MVARSLTLALVAACLWTLLILVDRSEPRWCSTPRTPPPAATSPPANPITVIDLALQQDGVRSMRELSEMVHLTPGESILAINDSPVLYSPACGAAPHYCNGLVLSGGRFFESVGTVVPRDSYVDFTVGNAHVNRRVLFLLH